MDHDTDSKNVGHFAVVLLANDFRSHVAQGARVLIFIVCLLRPRDSKVCQSQVPVAVEDKVCWLDILVDDVLRVHVLECLNQASDEKTCSLHRKFLLVLPEMEIAAFHQIHHKVQVFLVLERVMHVDDKVALEVLQQVELVLNRLDLCASILGHHLHGKLFAISASAARSDFMDPAEAAFSNDLQFLKL